MLDKAPLNFPQGAYTDVRDIEKALPVNRPTWLSQKDRDASSSRRASIFDGSVHRRT